VMTGFMTRLLVVIGPVDCNAGLTGTQEPTVLS
jgi:hypothetical protein